MTNRLTVHNATLSTAIIRVETITLGAKQVTLSVFRQLYEADILEGERLRGSGWGWVNYCPGSGNCNWARQGLWPHRHLVWQLGDELRRCALAFADNQWWWDRVGIEGFADLDDLPQLFIAV